MPKIKVKAVGNGEEPNVHTTIFTLTFEAFTANCVSDQIQFPSGQVITFIFDNSPFPSRTIELDSNNKPIPQDYTLQSPLASGAYGLRYSFLGDSYSVCSNSTFQWDEW